MMPPDENGGAPTPGSANPSLPGLTHPHSIRPETHCSTTDSRANDWPRSWARYPRGRRAAGNLAVVKSMTANSPSARRCDLAPFFEVS
jgi:hypothetical protein